MLDQTLRTTILALREAGRGTRAIARALLRAQVGFGSRRDLGLEGAMQALEPTVLLRLAWGDDVQAETSLTVRPGTSLTLGWNVRAGGPAWDG